MPLIRTQKTRVKVKSTLENNNYYSRESGDGYKYDIKVQTDTRNTANPEASQEYN